MGGVIRTQALGGSGVILVIKGLLLELVHVLNQVIGRLVGYIGEFLVKQVVLRDGMFDLIFGVVGVVQAVMESGGIGADGGHLGITIAFGMVMMGNGRGVMVGRGGRRVGRGVGRVVRAGSWVVRRGAIRGGGG